MSQMKDSGVKWIGEIPEEWNLNRLRFLAEFKTGGTPDDKYGINVEGNGFPWITAPDMDDTYKICNYSQYISEEAVNYNKYKLFPPRSILLVCIASVGKLGMIKEYAYSNQQITALMPHNDINELFLLYYIQSICHKIIADASSSVVPIVNTSYLKNIACLLPNVKEQTLIANFLDDKIDKIDGVLADLNKQIEILNKYKMSLITETVTKGLDHNVEMKDSGIDWIREIPVKWNSLMRVKDVFRLGKGLSITKEDLVDEGVKVVSYGQVHSKDNLGTCLNDSLFRFVEEKYMNKCKNSLVHKGDFIFADTSEDLEGCGNCVYIDYDDKIFAGYHTIIFNSSENKDNRFFAYLFKTDIWRSQIREKVTAVKVYTVSQKILKECKVIIPPYDEQIAIANYLDKKCTEIDKIIADKQAQIEKMEKYKKSLIYEYVTGKKRVKGAEELYG